MARVLAVVLMALAFVQARALDSEEDRPKGARRRARERALASQTEEDVAKFGCAQLGPLLDHLRAEDQERCNCREARRGQGRQGADGAALPRGHGGGRERQVRERRQVGAQVVSASPDCRAGLPSRPRAARRQAWSLSDTRGRLVEPTRKTAPESAQATATTASGRPQEGPKTARERSKRAQGGLKTAQEAPSMLHEASKRAPKVQKSSIPSATYIFSTSAPLVFTASTTA
eukprot:2538489-Pyramimonas_sp.AAC.1